MRRPTKAQYCQIAYREELQVKLKKLYLREEILKQDSQVRFHEAHWKGRQLSNDLLIIKRCGIKSPTEYL